MDGITNVWYHLKKVWYLSFYKFLLEHYQWIRQFYLFISDRLMIPIVHLLEADWLIFICQPRFHAEYLYKYDGVNQGKFIYRLLLLLLKDQANLVQYKMMEQIGEGTQKVQQEFRDHDKPTEVTEVQEKKLIHDL